MAEISNGYFNFFSHHQGITSSRGFIKAQRQVSISNTNDAIKQSLVILIHSIPPRDIHEAVPKQFAKGQWSKNTPWQPHSFNTVWIHQDLYFTHTPWEFHLTQFISKFGKVETVIKDLVDIDFDFDFKFPVDFPQAFCIQSFLFLLISFHFIPEIIPVQHSPPARQTRSQARAQAVLTPTPRDPLDGTPAVPQLTAKLDRGPILEGRKRAKKIKFIFRSSWRISRTFKGPGEGGEEEEEHSVEEEESDGTESFTAPVGASQGTRGTTLDQSKKPVSHQSEPFSLVIMQKMTQIMANLQSASSSEVSRLHL
ncbi:hypothetical protein O181_074922 [Austropuccinia psidii MF-1]|uniref:Uncharacterized protein n=1 Tax=Austropuccinia psidii MF-1 TaxID=1389203 RepID=A0A9Q3FBS1_9BASI|nr:hypothetical protein [Austropuccinia psidii MF-1]